MHDIHRMISYIQAPSSLTCSYCSGPDEGGCNGSEEGDRRASETLLFLILAIEDSDCGGKVLVCRLRVAGAWDCKSPVPDAKGVVTGRGIGV